MLKHYSLDWSEKPTTDKSEDSALDNETREEEDDFDTKYDSTWEDDTDITESTGVSMEWSYRAARNERAAKDMQNFRHMLRDVNEDEDDNENSEKSQEDVNENTERIQKDVEKEIITEDTEESQKDVEKETENKEESEKIKSQKELPNLLFYQNKKPSEPDGVLIEEFHDEWFGKYERLERGHSFIQWLFPIQEKGMNWDSYILTAEEIKLFRKDEEVKKRLLKSYKLMLDFYGIELLNERTGEVRRAKNWRKQFKNLNRYSHNNLRITRILKCLGILGFQHYQAPLVKFFLHQTLVEGELPSVKQSTLDYFLFSVVDKDQRKNLIKYAFQNFKPREEFEWCPKKIQRRFLKEIKNKKAENIDSDPSESESDDEAEETHPDDEGAAAVYSRQDDVPGAKPNDLQMSD